MTNANDPQSPRPNGPKKEPLAGGIFIALGLLGGIVVGFLNNQISAGMVGGMAVGGLIALGLYLRDRRG